VIGTELAVAHPVSEDVEPIPKRATIRCRLAGS
jgi:hypothetical protein